MIRETSGRVLFWCLIATFTFSIVEGVGGYLVHSIALQSDAVHMLTDAAGLMIAYFANVISKRPATVHLSFGYGKAEVVGALINCMFTTILTFWLLFEVAGRFLHPVEVQGAMMFVVASIGLLVNAGVVFILSKSGAHSLNTKAALLHAMGDLLASLVAIIAGAVIYFTNWSIVDPLLSLVVICLLIFSNYNLMKKSIIILMAGVPDHLSYEQVGKDILEVHGILEVHDLHIWYMSANKTALAAHVVACNPTDWPQILKNCQKMLLDKHQIDHVTLQYEFDDLKCQETGCCPE
jgi:cobalt-zinc-cadmium efflux system protein